MNLSELEKAIKKYINYYNKQRINKQRIKTKRTNPDCISGISPQLKFIKPS